MKIISTVGPGIKENYEFSRIVREGGDGFRFNWSHSNTAEIEEQITYIKERFDSSIIIDLNGHKVRVSTKIDSKYINNGETVLICEAKNYDKLVKEKSETVIPIDIEFDFKRLHLSKKIYMKNFFLSLNIVNTNDEYITAVAKGKGRIFSKSGLVFKDLNRIGLGITKEDKNGIDFALKVRADIVYISYVVEDMYVKEIKKYIKNVVQKNKNYKLPQVYSKIESQQGIDNLESILRCSDGIVLGRGDLYMEINILKYPLIQDKIVQRMKRSKKELILATHIAPILGLRGRVSIPEACDIYTHIKNKVNGIVLVGETAVVKEPWRNVKAIKKLINELES